MNSNLILDYIFGYFSWRELFLPSFWRFRRAANKINHAHGHLRKQIPMRATDWEALDILTNAYWRAEDEYYNGQEYTDHVL
jgi:hypothetical protein